MELLPEQHAFVDSTTHLKQLVEVPLHDLLSPVKSSPAPIQTNPRWLTSIQSNSHSLYQVIRDRFHRMCQMIRVRSQTGGCDVCRQSLDGDTRRGAFNLFVMVGRNLRQIAENVTVPTFNLNSSSSLPIVVAHGMGDSCMNPGMKSITQVN